MDPRGPKNGSQKYKISEFQLKDVVVIVSNPVNVYINQLKYTFPRECIHSLKSQGSF